MRQLALAVLLLAGAPALAQSRVIVIDPGHGGTDPGGTGNGQREKDVVLDVARRLADLLAWDAANGAGWKALSTRDDDTFVSLSARAAYANSQGADRFVSIHSNAFGDESANGTETFSYSEGTASAALRDLVQAEMLAAWGLRDRGAKTANYAVLRETAMPAVLHELGFITNDVDVAKLASATARQQAAEAHLRALQRHYDLAPRLPDDLPADGLAAAEPEGSSGCAAVGPAGAAPPLALLSLALLLLLVRRRV